MGRRHSQRERIALDRYDTPLWVIDQVAGRIPHRSSNIWEPAAGRGQVGAALMGRGYNCVMTDIAPRSPGVRDLDFLSVGDVSELDFSFDGIFTNPPFARTGVKFVEQALRLTEARRGWVMLLFGSEWDTASQRPHLISECPQYVGKIILQERIVWFDPKKTEDVHDDIKARKSKSAIPSTNHAWFLWDWRVREGWRPQTWWIPRRQDVGISVSDGSETASRQPGELLESHPGA